MNIYSKRPRGIISGTQLAKAVVAGVIAGAVPFTLVGLLSRPSNDPGRQSAILLACILAGTLAAIGATIVRNRWHDLGQARDGDELEL